MTKQSRRPKRPVSPALLALLYPPVGRIDSDEIARLTQAALDAPPQPDRAEEPKTPTEDEPKPEAGESKI